MDLDALVAESASTGSTRPCWLCTIPVEHPVRNYLALVREAQESGQTQSLDKVAEIIKREWDLGVSPSTLRRHLTGIAFRCH